MKEIFDRASMKYGSKDGLAFCGERVYEVMDLEAQHSTYLDFNERTISAKSTDDGDIGKYEIQVKVSLANYPDVSTTTIFTLIINPCVFEALTVTAGPSDAEYNIRSGIKSLGPILVSQDLCNYPISYEVLGDETFVTIDTGEVKIINNDIKLDGDFQIVLRAFTLVPTDFTSTKTTEKKVDHTFTLTMIDTCLSTELDELDIADMRTSVLGEPITLNFDNVKDSASRDSGDVSGVEFCGVRSYALQSNQMTSLTLDASKRILELRPDQ